MDMKRILRVDGLKKTYGEGENRTEALRGMSFDVLEGEFLGIMGPSGSGKTTLLNCVATMISPTGGRIFLDDQDVCQFSGKQLAEYRGNKIGYLFQEFELLDNLTAAENIILPLSLHGISRMHAEMSLDKMAERLDIKDTLHKFPGQLSGGQKQRVAAARALISEPSIVLADEPTGALDSANAKILMDKLLNINVTEKKTIMMVTHAVGAASYCSRILFIRDGEISHELRKKQDEDSDAFYDRIVEVVAQVGGGSAHVL